MKHFPIVTAPRDPRFDHARDEQLHSLMDGRARWPDGSVREVGVPLYERMREKIRLDALKEDVL